MQQQNSKGQRLSFGLSGLKFLRGRELSNERHFDWMRCVERLTQKSCDEIIATCREFPLVPPNTVGEERYPDHRQAFTRKVQLNCRTQWIFNFLRRVAEAASIEGAALELTEINREPQYVEYKPGWGHFDWHNDYSHGLPNAPRKLTIIIQLSSPESYEGGRLQCFGARIDDLPDELGTVLAFPSLLFHRVTPVTAGLRRALVSWVGGPRIR